jgi:hypothetical protein
MIEVRYAGVVVGRSAIIRELDTRGLFLGITEPMPVGTSVTLRIGDRDDVAGRVEAVSESQELARAGMRVRFDDAGAASLFGTPSEAGPEVVEPAWPNEPAAPAPVAAIAAAGSGSIRVEVAPTGSLGVTPSGHRRIVVDASTDKERDSAAPASNDDEGDLSVPVGGDSGRIPAPDPSAFNGGKKGRRNRRR